VKPGVAEPVGSTRATPRRSLAASRIALSLGIAAIAWGSALEASIGASLAQTTGTLSPSPETGSLSAARNIVHLSAKLSTADVQPMRGGVHWRIFEETAGADGHRKLVAQSSEATPAFTLPEGTFVVHAAFGLAASMKRITVAGRGLTERLVLNAGALRLTGLLGDTAIPSARLHLAVYVPEPGNSEAKLVVPNAKVEDSIGLPEGAYHVVSTLLDPAISGSTNQTNSVVSAELRVQAGKITDAILRHRAATMTLKLVSGSGGEALANTTFTILTPGGDVIREMIGAFPSLMLAEGQYVAIARHDGKTYQANFDVVAGADRDVAIRADSEKSQKEFSAAPDLPRESTEPDLSESRPRDLVR
jgi:hypothetical protein